MQQHASVLKRACSSHAPHRSSTASRHRKKATEPPSGLLKAADHRPVSTRKRHLVVEASLMSEPAWRGSRVALKRHSGRGSGDFCLHRPSGRGGDRHVCNMLLGPCPRNGPRGRPVASGLILLLEVVRAVPVEPRVHAAGQRSRRTSGHEVRIPGNGRRNIPTKPVAARELPELSRRVGTVRCEKEGILRPAASMAHIWRRTI